MPEFTLEHTESGKSKTVLIQEPVIRIGRSPEAEIPLRDTGVSKFHLQIEKSKRGYSFRDLDSSNGTYLNGMKRKSGRLRSGDVIQVGRIRITVNLDPILSPPPVEDTPAPIEEETQDLTPADEQSSILVSQPDDLSAEPQEQLSSVETQAEPDQTIDLEENSSSLKRTLIILGIVAFVPMAVGLGIGLFIGLKSPEPKNESLDLVNSPTPLPFIESPTDSNSNLENSETETDISQLFQPTETEPKQDEESTKDETPEASLSTSLDFPGLAPQPFGAYPDLETANRTIFRLYLDLLQRPPNRAEIAELRGLTHQQTWDWIIQKNSSKFLVSSGITQTFQIFLGRSPQLEEIQSIQQWTGDQILFLGCYLSATEEYRSPSFKRPKDLRQLANALLVDLTDKIPDDPKLVETIEKAILSASDLEQISRTLVFSETEIERPSVKSEAFRFLMRELNQNEIHQLQSLVHSDPQGSHWLRLALVGTAEYRSY